MLLTIFILHSLLYQAFSNIKTLGFKVCFFGDCKIKFLILNLENKEHNSEPLEQCICKLWTCEKFFWLCWEVCEETVGWGGMQCLEVRGLHLWAWDCQFSGGHQQPWLVSVDPGGCAEHFASQLSWSWSLLLTRLAMWPGRGRLQQWSWLLRNSSRKSLEKSQSNRF